MSHRHYRIQTLCINIENMKGNPKAMKISVEYFPYTDYKKCIKAQ